MQADRLNLALCQINPTVGDVEGNVRKMLTLYRQHAKSHDLVVFPELAVVGYPPEDLVLTPAFQERARDAMRPLQEETSHHHAALLVGNLLKEGPALYNAAFLFEKGEVVRTVRKHALPNSGVFDEKRVFEAGPGPEPVLWRGRSIGLLVCEDMWHPELFPRLARQGCDLVIVINGSPYELNKQQIREKLACEAATANKLMIAYCNMVGGQDELVFDGMSFAVSCSGEVVCRSAPFVEEVMSLSVGRRTLVAHEPPFPLQGRAESLYGAVTLGLRDYIDKNGFPGVLLGLSGGVDSALAACIAVDALGAERVRTYMLASPYTSQISLEDAAAIAQTLGVSHEVMSISPGMAAVEQMMDAVPDAMSGLAHENMQSRLRGLLLMTLSNSTGHLLITTGNKSEMAVGYATLYGDMCGAYNPLKDIYKTDVYAMAEWRNRAVPGHGLGPKGVVIPERVLTRAPSAELRDNQTDQDSLPPYDRLDAILHALVEERAAPDSICKRGFSPMEVQQVVKLLFMSEYKRNQSAPGPKVSSMNFGRDRRFPLINCFKF